MGRISRCGSRSSGRGGRIDGQPTRTRGTKPRRGARSAGPAQLPRGGGLVDLLGSAVSPDSGAEGLPGPLGREGVGEAGSPPPPEGPRARTLRPAARRVLSAGSSSPRARTHRQAIITRPTLPGRGGSGACGLFSPLPFSSVRAGTMLSVGLLALRPGPRSGPGCGE